MTKIVHEFCGICIQRRDIAGCFSGVWGGGLRFGGGELFVHRCAIARHSLLVVGQGCGLNRSPPVRRREDRGTASLSAPAVFCIALRAIARHSLLVVGQGLRAPTIRRLFGGVRTEEQPRSALRLFFASRFARLRGIAAQEKTAAVKGNGCRAPCSLSGFLHHKTPCGKYLRKKYHTMVLPVTQV